MAVKQPPAGGGAEDASGGSDGGGSTGDYGGINGLIVRDTDALLRYGAMLQALGDRVRSFANGVAEFASFQPLKRGVPDESWNTYSPSYFKGRDNIVGGLFKASDGCDITGETLKAFALAARRYNENAAEAGRQLKKYIQSSGQTQGSAFRPVERRGPGGANRLVGRVVKLPDGSSRYVVDGPFDPPAQRIFTKSTGAPILPPDQGGEAPDRTTPRGTLEHAVRQPLSTGSDGSARAR